MRHEIRLVPSKANPDGVVAGEEKLLLITDVTPACTYILLAPESHEIRLAPVNVNPVGAAAGEEKLVLIDTVIPA